MTENKAETRVAPLSESITEIDCVPFGSPILEIVALEKEQGTAASTGKGIE